MLCTREAAALVCMVQDGCVDVREKLKDWRGHHNEDSTRSAIGYNVPIAMPIPMASPARHRVKSSFRRPELGGRCSEGEHQIPSGGTPREMPLRQILIYQYLKKFTFLLWRRGWA